MCIWNNKLTRVNYPWNYAMHRQIFGQHDVSFRGYSYITKTKQLYIIPHGQIAPNTLVTCLQLIILLNAREVSNYGAWRSVLPVVWTETAASLSSWSWIAVSWFSNVPSRTGCSTRAPHYLLKDQDPSPPTVVYLDARLARTTLNRNQS